LTEESADMTAGDLTTGKLVANMAWQKSSVKKAGLGKKTVSS